MLTSGSRTITILFCVNNLSTVLLGAGVLSNSTGTDERAQEPASQNRLQLESEDQSCVSLPTSRRLVVVLRVCGA